jgi:hypothetical protein
MNKLSRRQFLGKSALGIGSVVIASQIPLNLEAGILLNLLKCRRIPGMDCKGKDWQRFSRYSKNGCRYGISKC